MKYVIKTIIIGLMVWMSVTLSSRAELKTAYIAYPITGEVITSMQTNSYTYDLDWYKKIMDLIMEGQPQQAEAVWKHMLQTGKSVKVNPGFVPVHNCFEYKIFTICEIKR